MKKYLRLVRLPRTRRNRAAVRLAERVLREENGAEIIEYALVAGLVIVGAIGAINCVGTKVLARWTSVNNSL